MASDLATLPIPRRTVFLMRRETKLGNYTSSFHVVILHIEFSLRPRIWKTLRESAPDQIRNYCAPRAMKSSRGCPLRQFIHEQGVKALSIDL